MIQLIGPHLNHLILLGASPIGVQVPQRFQKTGLVVVAALEFLDLVRAHCQPGFDPPGFHARGPGELLVGAVFEGGAADGGFAVFVRVEDVHEFFVVGFGCCFDGGLGGVGFPEVGVAAVGEEGLGGDGGLGGGGLVVLGFLVELAVWRDGGGWGGGFGGGGVFDGGFFLEEFAEFGIEVGEGVGGGVVWAPAEPAVEPAHFEGCVWADLGVRLGFAQSGDGEVG